MRLLLSYIFSLKDLFLKLNSLPTKTEIGLWGELATIYFSNNKDAFINSFQDTVEQRKTLQERIEFSGFSVNPLAEVISNEISQLNILLNNESVTLITYLSILHQNKILNNEFKIKVD